MIYRVARVPATGTRWRFVEGEFDSYPAAVTAAAKCRELSSDVAVIRFDARGFPVMVYGKTGVDVIRIFDDLGIEA